MFSTVVRISTTVGSTAAQETTGTPVDANKSRDAYNPRDATAGTPEK